MPRLDSVYIRELLLKIETKTVGQTFPDPVQLIGKDELGLKERIVPLIMSSTHSEIVLFKINAFLCVRAARACVCVCFATKWLSVLRI